jgi:hypothetical protein
MLPIYDSGDHLHPSDFGYNTMGDAVESVSLRFAGSRRPVAAGGPECGVKAP